MDQALTKPGGEIVHSCVFIADEIAYTKNGASVLAPWALMTLSDVIEFYSWDLPAGQEREISCWRGMERFSAAIVAT